MKKIILISLVLTMAAGILLAQTPRQAAFGNKAAMRGERGQCLDELELTDAQSKKIEAARATFERQRNTIQAETENLRMDIRDAMQAENFKRVKELNQQLTAKQLLLKNAHTDMIAAFMKELSKEQKAILQKNMPMMMGSGQRQGQGHNRGNRNNSRWGRRGRGMDNDRGWDDCDDHDGPRKFRHRN